MIRTRRAALAQSVQRLYKSSARRHLRADLSAQLVDQPQAFAGFDVPKGPAVAGFGALRHRTDARDRTNLFAVHDGAVVAHQRAVALWRIDQFGAWQDHAALDKLR